MEKCVKSIFVVLCIVVSCDAHAFLKGGAFGVGASALSGMNVLVGYKYPDSASWLGRFGARLDFATTAPVQSVFDSAFNHIASDGVNVGDGVRINDGILDVSHYAALIDFFPWSGSMRITGGYMFSDVNINASINGEIENVPSQRFYFYINGDHYYYNGNVFRGSATIDWDYNGPYIGTGADIEMSCGFYIYLDAGIVYTNRPARLSLSIPHEQLYIYDTETATWSPVTVPKLDADVAAATNSANQKLSHLRVFPVVKLGFLYRF